MKKTTKERVRVKKKKGINQFGKQMATAIPTPIIMQAWKCSECGAVSEGTNGKPPVRCSNRRTCGRLFHILS